MDLLYDVGITLTRLCSNLKQSVFPNTIFIIGKDEPHDAPMVYRLLNDKTETQQGKAIKSWLLWKL